MWGAERTLQGSPPVAMKTSSARAARFLSARKWGAVNRLRSVTIGSP